MQNNKQGYPQGIRGQSSFPGQFSAKICKFRKEAVQERKTKHKSLGKVSDAHLTQPGETALEKDWHCPYCSTWLWAQESHPTIRLLPSYCAGQKQNLHSPCKSVGLLERYLAPNSKQNNPKTVECQSWKGTVQQEQSTPKAIKSW